MHTNELPEAIAKHIRVVNAHDTDAATAPFADDAHVNDVQREIIRSKYDGTYEKKGTRSS